MNLTPAAPRALGNAVHKTRAAGQVRSSPTVGFRHSRARQCL